MCDLGLLSVTLFSQVRGKVCWVTRPGLRVIEGSLAAAGQPATADPRRFQQECVEAYLASWVARGFSPVTIENDSGVLERMLALLDRPAWEVTAGDIDRVAGSLAVSGLAASTRRGYVQAFKGFHRFLSARKAAEIEAMFGIRIECPVDEFNASRHVGDDSPGQLPPPSAARVEGFFAFLRGRIATARKYGPAARDYALFRTLYHAGLRSDEAARLDVSDVHLDRGPFGKLHVRFGKGTRTSGPRARWVPLLDGLDLILGWYLAEIRPRFGTGPALFCDEGGGAIHRGTVGNRLRVVLAGERAGPEGHFSPHGLRHACATHN